MDATNPFARKSALPRSPVGGSPVSGAFPAPIATSLTLPPLQLHAANAHKQAETQPEEEETKATQQESEPQIEAQPPAPAAAATQPTPAPSTVPPFPTASAPSSSSSASSSLPPSLKSRSIPSIGSYNLEDTANPFGRRERRGDDAPLPSAAALASQDMWKQQEEAEQNQQDAPVETEETPAPAPAPVPKKPLLRKPKIPNITRPTTAPAVAEPTNDAPSAVPAESAAEPTEAAPAPAPAPEVNDRPLGSGRSDRPLGAAARGPLDEAALEAMLASDNPFGSRGKVLSSPNRPIRSRPATAAPAVMAAEALAESPTQPAEEAEFVRPDAPLTSRLVDKQWKVRADAYGEVVTQLQSGGPDAASLSSSLTPYLARLCADTNVVALEKGLEATRSIVDTHPDGMGLLDEVMPPLLKKGLPGRPATFNLTLEILYAFIAIGGSIGAIPVISHLLAACADNRAPKLQAACVSALRHCLAAFGPKVVRVDSLLSVWPDLLSNSNAAVRKEAMELGAELYRWMGPVLTQQMGAFQIKEAQSKELTAMFASIPYGQARPTKLTRAEQAKQAKGGKSAASSEAFDPLSLVPAVDVCSKLSTGWNDFLLGSAKPMEKKEKLLELCGLATASPKISVSGSTQECCATLSKLLRDANLIVVGEALKCIVALAQGARAEFASCAHMLLSNVLALLKEKKTNVLQPAHATLDLFFQHCIDLEQAWEPMQEGLADKMAKVRNENLLLAQRWLAAPHASGKVSNSSAKTMGEAVFKLVSDSDSEVREQALQTLGALLRLVGRKPLAALLQKLELNDAKKAAKVLQLGGDKESRASTPPPVEAKPAAAARSESVARPSTSAGTRPAASRKPSSGSLTSRPSTAVPSASSRPKSGTLKKTGTLKAGSSSSSSSGGSSASSVPDVSVPVYGYEESAEQLAQHEAVGSETCNLISSKKWSDTVEGLQKLTAQLQVLSNADLLSLLPFVFYYLAKTPSFKPSNVQVSKQLYDTLPVLSTLLTPFPSSLLLLPLPDLYNKISDKKFQESVALVLLSFGEAMSPRVLASEWIKVCDKESKNIKSMEAAILLLPRLLDEFGCAQFDVNALIDTAKGWNGHVQKGVRDAAAQIFVSIYKQTGSMLKDLMLSSLKPATITALEAEFAALPASPPPFVPKRTVRGQSSSAGTLNLDALIPRTDISGQITEELLANLNNAGSWKVRKEAMTSVHTILAGANHRIAAKDGGLLEALKQRLNDNNKNLAKDALQLLCTLIADMGQPIVKHASKLLPALLTAMGDSKPFVKAEAIKAMEQWIQLSGLQACVKFFPKALEASSPARKEVLDLLVAHLPAGPNRSLDGVSRWDVRELVLPLLLLCADKQPDVRAASEKVLEFVVPSVGFDVAVEETKQLKKAMVLQIMPTLEKMRHAKLPGKENNASAEGQASTSVSAEESSEQELPRPATAPVVKRTVSRKPSASGTLTHREAASATSAASSSTSAAPATPATGAEEKKSSILRARSRQSTLPIPVKKGALAAVAPTPEVDAESASADTSADAAPSSTGSSISSLLKKLDMSAKRSRVLKDSKRVRGVYREYNEDEISELDQQLYTLVTDELYAMLFHKEFQRQVHALEQVEQEVTAHYESILSISDLLLKWCSWRLMDANTTLLAKMLPFLQKLFQALDAHGDKLSDGEAANILPTLIEKALGHNTVRFRVESREVLQVLVAIYPVSKLLAYITHGFDSKNKRVQSECCEQVGGMVAKYGLQVTDAKKLVSPLAQLVGAADSTVRTAALNALAQLYQASGEDMFAALNKAKDKIGAKQMAMIEERVKKISISTASKTSSESSGEDSANSSSHASALPVPSLPLNGGGVPASPAPSPSALTTPRKSMLPMSSTLLRKKSMLPSPPSSATKYRSSTMRPGQMAKAREEFAAMAAFEHSIPEQPAAIAEEESSAQVLRSPTSSPTALARPSHQRYRSNVSEYVSADKFAQQQQENLPGCFSLELEPLQQPGPNDMQLASPAAAPPVSASSLPSAVADSSTGVLQSSFLSDTLIVLSEPSMPAVERIAALQHMSNLLHSQGISSLQGNEEMLVEVLIAELANSFHVYPATGLVTVQQAWNQAALNSMQAVVANTELMEALPTDSIKQLMQQLFQTLSDKRVLSSPACTYLVEACNQCILSALEFMPRTRAFTLTLSLLRESMLTPSRGNEVQLVSKCLEKLYKLLAMERLAKIDVSELLQELYTFTEAISPADPQHDSTALRPVLNILHFLVEHGGEDIRQMIQHMPEESTLAQYVEQLLQAETEAASEAHTPPQPQFSSPLQITPPQPSFSTPPPVSISALSASAPVPLDSEASLSAELSSIFTSLKSGQEQDSAVHRLHAFTALHPEVDQSEHWSRLNPMLESIIKTKITHMMQQQMAAATNMVQSPNSSAAWYREQITELRQRANSATAPQPTSGRLTSPFPSRLRSPSPSPAASVVSSPAPSPLASPSSTLRSAITSSPSLSSSATLSTSSTSLAAIRARFKATQSTPTAAPPSDSALAATTTAPAETAAAPQPAAASSLHALRAKLATMNAQKK